MPCVLRHLSLAAIPTALLIFTLTACGGAETTPSSKAGSSETRPRSVTLPRGVAARSPPGWQLLRQRISGVTYPVQVLAAASYDSELGPPPLRGCQPRRVLDQKPFDGVLLQVVEWTRSPQRDIGDFPLRKRPFRLPTRALSKRFECVGTYNIAFRDRRRAFQAFLWLDPTHVEPRLRSQAIDLLSSIRFRDR